MQECLNSPVAAAVIVLLGLLFPQLRALLPGNRNQVAGEVPVLEPVDMALTAAVQLARRKFPWMEEAEAVHRFVFEAIRAHEKEEAAKAEAYVKATAPVPDLPTA